MCIYFREISISCIFLVYLFSRMTFKRKFRVYCEINQNSRNSRKYVHAKISTLKVTVLVYFYGKICTKTSYLSIFVEFVDIKM